MQAMLKSLPANQQTIRFSMYYDVSQQFCTHAIDQIGIFQTLTRKQLAL